MNKFIMFWDCLGINSGQIQVVLNLIVIVLATIAALYAKKQIAIAQQLREDEIRLSRHRLTVSILDLAYSCKKDIFKLRKDFDDFEIEFSKLLQSRGFKLDDPMPEFDYTFREWLKFPTETLSRIEKTNRDLVAKLHTNNGNSDLSLHELETILIKLMDIASSLEHSKQGIIEKIEEIRTSYNTI